jgi:MATE family multidrug resistance protein
MHPARREFITISRLAAPVVATQLGVMMLWVVDLLMVGAVGVEALGTVSLGRVWIVTTLIFSMGILFGIDPLITQAHGAGDSDLMSRTLQHGLVLSLAISIPIGVMWLYTEELLLLAGQDQSLSAGAEKYLLVQLPLIPSYMLFIVLRQYLLGRGIVYPTMWVTFLGNGVNVLANWALIFGHLGFPKLGVIGAGISTSVTQWFMLAVLVLWIILGKLHRGAWTGWTSAAFDIRELLRVLRFGLPVGIQISLELWAFCIANLWAGWLGAVSLASHTIVINLASLSFMVPLGISLGAVTRVGNLIGEGNPQGAQRAAWVAFGMGGGVMSIFVVLFVSGREFLPSLYSADVEVIAMSAVLLPVAAAFQLFDGLQVVGSGVLRGMGKTKPAAAFNLIGYYVIAMPLAYLLAFRADMGLPGIWWALCVALAAVAILLVAWIWWRGPAKVECRIVSE